MGEEELRICGQCRHYRTKAIANPFSRNLDVWTPDILEVKTKWEGEQNDLALRESQRFESGQEFDYEPNYYPWCARWTEQDGRFRVDPVTGDRSPLFVLCARANHDGRCALYEAAANR